MLNLLDGSPFHVSMPKTTATQDVMWKKRQPIFATGPEKVAKFHTRDIVNEGETRQMDARWQYIELKHIITDINYDIKACGVCFSKLILE